MSDGPILIVDDDAFVRTLLREMLSEQGHPLREAENGQEALELEGPPPKVVLLDLLMPEMSGIECAQLLQERYPKSRVILISGSIFEDKRPQPDQRGAAAYLEKSEVPERLHATILALAAETTTAPPSRTNT